jgi:hypothetical protein
MLVNRLAGRRAVRKPTSVSSPRSQQLRTLLTEAAATGHVRTNVAPDELAGYCLHALGAAGGLPSKVAARRLVTVTLTGLRLRRWPVRLPLQPATRYHNLKHHYEATLTIASVLDGR